MYCFQVQHSCQVGWEQLIHQLVELELNNIRTTVVLAVGRVEPSAILHDELHISSKGADGCTAKS